MVCFQNDWETLKYFIHLQEEQYFFLKDIDCISLSFYECFAAYIKSEKPVECLPKVFKSIGKIDLSEFDTCKNESTDYVYYKMYEIYSEVFMEIDEFICPKSCNQKEYLGHIEFKEDISNYYNNTFIAIFDFFPPYKVIVSEEYLIYDFIGLVGSVGGTLGLFIGFSFYGIIFKFCNKLRNL